MTAARQARGRWAEGLVARLYERTGYQVASRNWRCAEGELDIVAVRRVKGDVEVVFCEVKARSSDAYGPPAAAVGPVKQARLRRLASLWLADARTNGLPRGVQVRFDVAAVLGSRVDIIEGAF